MADNSPLSCFKAYDIRGKVPDDIDEDVAYTLGKAYVSELAATSVVVGYDVRLESEPLATALIRGITDAGANVLNIGLCGTEEVYFSTFHHQTDGGIMVTASHNPKGYNGMKLVAKGARPISGDSGLFDIKRRMIEKDFIKAQHPGSVEINTDKADYVDHVFSYVNLTSLKPLKVVMDCGNGSAGAVIRQIAAKLPFDCVFVNDVPDGNFPNGVPNPLLPEMRSITARAVMDNKSDFGIAWDGDFDRCFLFDENGQFIEGYYIVGLLAEAFLKKHPGEKIIHDPRLTWNTIDICTQYGGQAIQSKTGHAFIKERMRKENAIYGGEMSAHHYFRDFAYCDSGMIPWLLVAELISVANKPLSQLVSERQQAYPCSGEINFKVKDVQACIEEVRGHFSPENPHIDETDGLSMEFVDWRFNLRGSNTEPLLRLNVEARANYNLVWKKVEKIESIIKE